MPKSKTKQPKTDLKEEIDKSVKMFDVSKPGQSPPSATSRPIIVAHGGMIKKDPMVREDEAAGPGEEPVKTKDHAETVLEPLGEEPAEPEKKEEVPAGSEEPGPAEAPEEPEKKEEPSKEPEESKPEPEGLAGLERLSQKTEEKKQNEELAAKTKEAEASIQSKEFFVPIGQVSRRRSKNRLILLLLVVAGGAVFLNFAVDAGIIDIGLEPLTDLL